MDLASFRIIVDSTQAQIQEHDDDLSALYAYVGLSSNGCYQRAAVQEALYGRIRASFTAGQGRARQRCRDLQTDLIREHVILDVPLDPYFAVLSRLADGLNASVDDHGDIIGDWAIAVKAARDDIVISNWGDLDLERMYAREFSVAKAARALKANGYTISLANGLISLEEDAESALVMEIERLVSKIGGLNLARRIFTCISPFYDSSMERYHLVPSVSMSGGGRPQVPWGYLLQLAVKHVSGQKPYADNDSNWNLLLSLITNYAAVMDVQPYVPQAFRSFVPQGLLQHIQETALYDLMFRMPQLRPSDVVRLCKGILEFIDFDRQTPDGWTLNQAFEIMAAVFNLVPNVRGPVTFLEADLRRGLPDIPVASITRLLNTVLSHPETGVNRKYSRPTDAPTEDCADRGIDFIFRPLLRLPGRRYLMIDRSVCAAACPEALLAALRNIEKNFEESVGLQAERFLEAELNAAGITVHSGDYNIGPDHGECDLVFQTDEKVVFVELKKKALTRNAKAGSDVDLLLDLSGSLLAAQAQAGWHEVRLRKFGRLDLNRSGNSYILKLGNREIERVAVALLDYGSFQDRIFLKHMMETTLGSNFTPIDPELNKRFEKINLALTMIRSQLAALYPDSDNVTQPFFHCWFLSLPQVLVLLDDVADAQSFWAAFQQVRHVSTGTSDFYFELSHMRRMRAKAPMERTRV